MIMRKIQYLFIALFICLEIQAQDKFNIRGVLPWHNFLSGPTSWMESVGLPDLSG